MQDKIQIVFDTSYLESKNYNYDSSVFKRGGFNLQVQHPQS